MRISIREKKSFALIGCPLGHSISPFIHGKLMACSGTVGSYALEEIEKDNLASALENRLSKLDGFNVTIPYKSDIIPYLDSVSQRAKLFGAVNTVAVKDGKFFGYNTDCLGFIRAIDSAKIDVCGKALILGSGGVSRMFAFECAIAGCDITIAVRETGIKKAEALCAELDEKLNVKAEIITYDKISGGYDLIINGTPVGMYPDTDVCPLSEDTVKSSKAVFDAIYNPLKTKLIKLAEKNGVKYANGLSMLVWQAAAAQETWNDVEFDKDDIQRIIEQSEEYLKNE